MSDMKHVPSTPRPWLRWEIDTITNEAANVVVATLPARPETAANSALIVRAVNNIHDLIGACKQSLVLLHERAESTGLNAAERQHIETIRKVLAKADPITRREPI